MMLAANYYAQVTKVYLLIPFSIAVHTDARSVSPKNIQDERNE